MEPLKQLFLALAEIFDSEGRGGGAQAAEALINASHKIKLIAKLSWEHGSCIHQLRTHHKHRFVFSIPEL